MLVFRRIYSVSVQRNAAYFTLFCCVFVIGIAAIQVTLFESLATQLVNENIFGRYLAWGHVFFLLAIFLCIFFGRFLSKKGYIAHPSGLLLQKEIEAYNFKYHTDFALPKKYTKHQLILFFSLFIPLLFIGSVRIFFGNIGLFLTYLVLIVGFYLMFKMFYGTVRKMMKKSNESFMLLFEHANRTIPGTEIKLENQRFKYSAGGVASNLKMSGFFRDHSFSADYNVSGSRFIKPLSSGALKIDLNKNIDLKFSISEKRTPLNQFEGVDLDECFKKRFDLKGVKVKQLSDKFKKLLLESPRTINLKVDRGFLSQSMNNVYILPFYSAQGLVLFLDFMLDLAYDLTSIHPIKTP